MGLYETYLRKARELIDRVNAGRISTAEYSSDIQELMKDYEKEIIEYAERIRRKV